MFQGPIFVPSLSCHFSDFQLASQVVSPRDSDPGKSRMPVNKQPALPLNTSMQLVGIRRLSFPHSKLLT